MTQAATAPAATLVEELLQAKFEPTQVKALTKRWTGRDGQEKQAGPFSYVEDEAVMDRLDEVLGLGGWQVPDVTAFGDTCVRLTLSIKHPATGEWTQYADFGYATRTDSAEPLKEAWTDAFRRCARMPGVARYIYAGEENTQGQANTQQVGGVAPLATAASPAPAAPAPQPVAAPQQGQAQPTPAQPAAPTATAQPSGAAPALIPPTCPAHGYPWTQGKYGPYCKSKAREGESQNARGYCNLKPQVAA